MFDATLQAFIEGRGSIASVERAILQSGNPMKTRGDVERELALEWSLINVFTTIPPPPHGLPRLQQALRAAPAPVLDAESAAELQELNATLTARFSRIPPPEGGYEAALGRLKNKLGEVAQPQAEIQDIAPGFEGLRPVTRRRRATSTRIIRLPQPGSMRDVLAAGKDLPENPDDLPPSE